MMDVVVVLVVALLLAVTVGVTGFCVGYGRGMRRAMVEADKIIAQYKSVAEESIATLGSLHRV